MKTADGRRRLARLTALSTTDLSATGLAGGHSSRVDYQLQPAHNYIQGHSLNFTLVKFEAHISFMRYAGDIVFSVGCGTL